MGPTVLVKHQLNDQGEAAGVEADKDEIVDTYSDQGECGEELEPGVLGQAAQTDQQNLNR